MNDITRHPATNSESTGPWCLFRSGSGHFGVSLEAVAEVVEVERLVRLPHSPPQILGLCTLRREIVPVIGLERTTPASDVSGLGTKATVLVLKTGRGRWGIRVNAEGTTVAEEPLDSPTAALESPNPSGLAISGTITRGSSVYAVIDPDSTWNDVRVRVEEWYQNHWGRGSSPQRGEARTRVGSEWISATEAVR